ncbi:MAG: long-chain fatty acid--CoA ligase [Acidobacteriota bacterium]
MSIRTLCDVFRVTSGFHKKQHLLHKVDGTYQPVSTAELTDRVQRASHALGTLGVAPGDCVALMADNGPHWPVVDFATLCRGAVTVPVYPTLPADQAAYVISDSEAKVLFVETREQLDGLLEERAALPAVEHFVLIDPAAAGPEETDAEVTSFASLLAGAEGHDPAEFEALAAAVEPDHLASLVYTSGTTGKPKGVMLSHDNFVSNISAGLALNDIRSDQTALSFLPLSHVFERTVSYCYYYRGVSIAFAESIHSVAQNFQEIRPHVFVSVPRVYEKVLAKVRENVAAGSAVQQKIFRWAQGVARRSLPERLAGDHPSGFLGLQLALADGLVFSKIRDRLGGRFEFAVSGGAPLAKDVAEFFWGAGIPIYEGYGLTETSPIITTNSPGAVRLGTVGKVIPRVEVRIADDGEILTRGPNVMQGYRNLPEETAEAIDADGWFHTGDIGELDDDGYLSITDRKKELIVNAYGKNIAPAPIENALKASTYISQAMVIGDRQKFLGALLAPDFENLATWARARGLAATDPDAMIADSAVRELLASEVQKVNAELAHYEEIVRWELVPREFTVEDGELTPTQKLKRRVIRERWQDEIAKLFA